LFNDKLKTGVDATAAAVGRDAAASTHLEMLAEILTAVERGHGTFQVNARQGREAVLDGSRPQLAARQEDK
jgi:hypothetical protein